MFFPVLKGTLLKKEKRETLRLRSLAIVLLPVRFEIVDGEPSFTLAQRNSTDRFTMRRWTL